MIKQLLTIFLISTFSSCVYVPQAAKTQVPEKMDGYFMTDDKQKVEFFEKPSDQYGGVSGYWRFSKTIFVKDEFKDILTEESVVYRRYLDSENIVLYGDYGKLDKGRVITPILYNKDYVLCHITRSEPTETWTADRYIVYKRGESFKYSKDKDFDKTNSGYRRKTAYQFNYKKSNNDVKVLLNKYFSNCEGISNEIRDNNDDLNIVGNLRGFNCDDSDNIYESILKKYEK